jgi:hypothetical protein
MAFSQADHLQILRFLGYKPTPESRTQLTQRLAYMVGADVDLEKMVKDMLRELVKIQEDLDGARLGAGRSFNSGGSSTVQYFRGDRLNELRQHGRQYVGYLSDATGMVIGRDVFAATQRGANHGQVLRG